MPCCPDLMIIPSVGKMAQPGKNEQWLVLEQHLNNGPGAGMCHNGRAALQPAIKVPAAAQWREFKVLWPIVGFANLGEQLNLWMLTGPPGRPSGQRASG